MNRSCYQSIGLVFCFGFVFVGQNRAYSAEFPHLDLLGITYHRLVHEEPRINCIQVLQIDLSNPKIRPAVVIGPDPDGEGPAETALSDPLELAAIPSVQAFVNTNPWDSFPDEEGKKNRRWHEGQPVDIHGVAVAGGKIRSDTSPSSASVWFDQKGKAHIGDEESDRPFVEAVHGFQQIVRDGELVIPEGGAIHPRTAIGVDETGEKLWLVVVDGRQDNHSEGMNLHELGSVMLELGCWHATNMDGGGSSVMGLRDANGTLRVVNSPSDRKRGKPSVRPLPMILTIQSIQSSENSSEK